ncbi:hypothetical protein E2562_008757 [Oryza meyeriana var. granulata]|uniref:Uncharacterized protein n=1 Tax=Oryza meyeriana var. granulata TaxID=110450 RepID=A0A6G1CYG2_9ORYZ|nr:hypothetical protein E2562_008757 [Oryza meyeriana var. granulata]
MSSRPRGRRPRQQPGPGFGRDVRVHTGASSHAALARWFARHLADQHERPRRPGHAAAVR